MNKKSNLKYLLPIRSLMFIIIFVLGSLITKKKLTDISNWWSPVATLINIITIIIIVLIAKKFKTNYFELIDYKKKKNIKQIVIMSTVIIIVSFVGMYLAGFICYGVIPYMAPMMAKPLPLSLAIINFIFLPITVPFAEDALYLGCGVNNIKNKYMAIIIPAFFYALQHSFIPTIFDFKYIIYRFLSFLPLTIILCWHYRKNKNPLPIMVGHTLVELASVITILITSINPEIYQIWLRTTM